MGKKGHTEFRKVEDGRFVKDSYGKKHPKLVVKEIVPNPGYGDTGRGKKK